MPRLRNNGPHQQKLKSLPGPTQSARAMFINFSPRIVNVLWMDFRGKRVTYTTDGLKPRQVLDICTYKGHPWIFRDHNTGDKLVCNTESDSHKKEVFFPIPFSEDDPRATQVNIILPVYTLKERSLQLVRSYLKSKEDCAKLEIPVSLQLELANPVDLIHF